MGRFDAFGFGGEGEFVGAEEAVDKGFSRSYFEGDR